MVLDVGLVRGMRCDNLHWGWSLVLCYVPVGTRCAQCVLGDGS